MAKYVWHGYFGFDYTANAKSSKGSQEVALKVLFLKHKSKQDNHFTKLTKKQKSIACYFGEINKMTKESTESPRFGIFINYVEIPSSSSSEVFYTLP